MYGAYIRASWLARITSLLVLYWLALLRVLLTGLLYILLIRRDPEVYQVPCGACRLSLRELEPVRAGCPHVRVGMDSAEVERWNLQVAESPYIEVLCR